MHLDDLQSVAVRIAKREHRRRSRPAQHVVGVNTVREKVRVDRIGIGRREPNAGLDTGGQAVMRSNQGDRRRRLRRCDFNPPCTAAHGDVEPLLEPECLEVEGERLLLVGNGNTDRPNVLDGTGVSHLSHHCSSWFCWAYINDPGVVSTSPVSIHVLSPERIIGQPPKSCEFAPSRSWSWVTVRRHESPTGSISHVTRVVPSCTTSSPQSARAVCTNRRGGSTSTFSPSMSGAPARGLVMRYADPGAHVDSTLLPN